MIITFKTEAYANITMFGDVAKNLLRLMEQNQNIPGAILADDVADALCSLKRNLSEAKTESSNNQDKDDEDPPVSLNKRALPLIELLEAAASTQVDVRWEQGC